MEDSQSRDSMKSVLFLKNAPHSRESGTGHSAKLNYFLKRTIV